MRLHPSKLPSPSNQPLLDSFLKQSKCSDYRTKKITELIVNMVVRDLHPAATVEGSEFKALINYIEPGYRVPSANHITEVARRKYLSGKNAISSYLQSETHYMAFTTDIWTIDDSWNIVSIVLATAPFPEHHTAANIVSKVKQVMEEFHLEVDLLLAVVHDQCSNMQLAGEILNEECENCQSISCAAHHLQLCVEEGLAITAISQAVGAAKNVIAHFKHSALTTSELKNVRNQWV